MAANMNQLSLAQQAIVNQIIAAGQQMGASNTVIMAAVNFANAESAFDPFRTGPTPGTTIKGLFQYSDETWTREWNAFKKANPNYPLSSLSASAVRANVDAMIQVMYFDLNRDYAAFNAGQLPTPPVVKENLKGYNKKVHQLEKSGIHIGTNFLQYAYLFHNTSAKEVISVNNTAFKLGNLTRTAFLVCTQTGQGSPGTGLTCPGQPDPSLAYSELNNATQTGRFYENGVLYIKDNQTGQEYWSIPTAADGSLDVTKFTNGIIATQNFTADGQIDPSVPGSVALDATASADIVAAYQAWTAAGNDPANVPADQIFFDDGSGAAIDARDFLTTLVGGVQTTSEIASDDILIGDSTANGGNMLVGGMGNDFIIGGNGNDVLYGGAGNDVLAGGAGNDTYILDGSGRDTIEDKVGDNRVLLNGKLLFDFTTSDGVNYLSADGAFTGILQNGDFIVNDTVTGDQVTLNQNFQSGDFGITLSDAPVDPVYTLTLTGDVSPVDTDPAEAGIQAASNSYGNPLGMGMPYEDILYDSSGNDHILSGEQTDLVMAWTGDDWIEGGNGNDVLLDGLGNDLIEGGAGKDLIYAGDGNDRLYGNVQIDTATAITNGSNDTGSGNKGDWLAGQSGDDTLTAGADDDVLSGGGGNDMIIAGAGNDLIFGDSNVRAVYIMPGGTPRYSMSGVDYYSVSQDTFNWGYTYTNGVLDYTTQVASEPDPADAGNDIIYAGNGDDRVWAGSGSDVVYGEDGADQLNGDAGDDILIGGAGDDTLIGKKSLENWNGATCAVLFGRSRCGAANDDHRQPLLERSAA